MTFIQNCFLFKAIALSGCASFPVAPEAARIRLEAKPSRAVALYQPKLVVADDRTVLDGWVYRQFGATTTALSHIDVEFVDEAGEILRTEIVGFAPADLGRGGHKIKPRGHFMLPLTDLPPATVTIRVRAHDAAEHSP